MNLENDIKELLAQMKSVSCSDLSNDQKVIEMRDLSEEFNRKISVKYETTKKTN